MIFILPLGSDPQADIILLQEEIDLFVNLCICNDFKWNMSQCKVLRLSRCKSIDYMTIILMSQFW